ncbi:hypothetical protein Tco_1328627 [Tanacetum coccineum]
MMFTFLDLSFCLSADTNDTCPSVSNQRGRTWGNPQPRPPAAEAHAYSETGSANSVGNMQPVSNEAINSMFVHNKNPDHTGPSVSNQRKRTHQHSQVRPSSCEASSLTRVCRPTTTGRSMSVGHVNRRPPTIPRSSTEGCSSGHKGGAYLGLAAGLQKCDMTLNRNVCILFVVIAFIKEKVNHRRVQDFSKNVGVKLQEINVFYLKNADTRWIRFRCKWISWEQLCTNYAPWILTVM